MTREEIIEAFNIQYNNVNSNAAPGFDTYEISYYLTKAHREVINGYYNGNLKGDSIDSKEKVRSLLGRYIKSASIQLTDNNTKDDTLPSLRRASLELAADTWQLLLESIKLNTGREVLIKPVTYDTLLVTVEDPFRQPSLYRAWRLDSLGEDPTIITESNIPNTNVYRRHVDILFSTKLSATVDMYNYTYLAVPEAIVLDDFETTYGPNYSIDGISTVQIPATISRFLWDIIINRAVELAVKDYKENTLQNQVITAQRIE